MNFYLRGEWSVLKLGRAMLEIECFQMLPKIEVCGCVAQKLSSWRVESVFINPTNLINS